jgi:Flp pilus assembly protein CpaB
MARTRGCLWLMGGAVVALLAGLVGYLTLSNATAQRTAPAGGLPEVQVVVAAQAVAVRSALSDNDVVLRSVPVNLAPEGALQETRAVLGKVVMTDLVPGEVILQQRLADPNVTARDGRAALMMAGDEVLMAFPALDLLSKSGVLKAGDHVDLLFSLQVPANRGLAGVRAANGGSETELTAFNVLPNVTISALVAGKALKEGEEIGAPVAYLFLVSSQDALVLKYVKDAGGTLDMVLRAPGAEQPTEADPVDVDYVIKRYKLPTEVGR